MANSSFYWHDYETWGVNPRVDRPAQFAGIRTDENLEIIGEPLMIYAQPTVDFLPHPEAVLITGMHQQQQPVWLLVQSLSRAKCEYCHRLL